MKVKRKTSTEESRKYWKAVDRLLAETTGTNRIELGDPWLDSVRDISASIIDEPSKAKK